MTLLNSQNILHSLQERVQAPALFSAGMHLLAPLEMQTYIYRMFVLKCNFYLLSFIFKAFFFLLCKCLFQN